ncbi:IS110 family transposase [Amycolatopsis lexingtonensis]|uniref:IS110 family transposase n=1 Tax=Amycolatopsis lexingtonensis TaxID=218822 RepID=UPI003F717FFF
MVVVVLGIDVHNNTHTAVAVDEVGRKLGKQTVRATDSGHRQLLRRALRNWPEAEVVFAVEDCRHVSTRLERALLAAGQAVVRAPPKLTAGARSSARTRGKSDPIDAWAIARATPREPDLPTATHDEASREVKLLVDHREDMIGTRTRMQNRLRRHLHELDPELDPAARSLDRRCELDRLTTWPAQQPASMVMRIAAELVTDIRDLTVRITALERELANRMTQQAPQLLALPGCGALTAAKIIAETANITRFRSEACYAMHAGVAPIPASSGNTNRHRPARGGNRQLNAAFNLLRTDTTPRTAALPAAA